MKVYLDYTQEELDWQYEHRNFVPDADDCTAAQLADGERMREAADGGSTSPTTRTRTSYSTYSCLSQQRRNGADLDLLIRRSLGAGQ